MKCPRSIDSIGAGKFIWSEQRLAAHKVPGVKARSLAARNFRATHHLCSRFNKSRISVSSVSCLVIAGAFGASDCMI